MGLSLLSCWQVSSQLGQIFESREAVSDFLVADE